jgi:hypothetical protein
MHTLTLEGGSGPALLKLIVRHHLYLRFGLMLRPFSSIFAPALLLVAGCSAPDAADPAGSRPAQVASGPEPSDSATYAACPGRDFESYFAAFSADSAVQRQWTAFPLEHVYLVADERPEPRTQIDSLSANEAKFPLVPSAAERAHPMRQVTIEDVNDGRKRVTIAQPDTDWVLHFIFAPVAGCWRLVRTEDWSM